MARDGRTILVFGSINMDLVARVRKIARPGETVLSRRADSFFGGKGANQAMAAARIARGSPLKVAFAGAVGNDPFGQSCLGNLRDNGIDTEAVRIVDEPTGCAFITVDEAGENAITVASGANMAVRAADLPDDLLDEASVLVLQMEVPFAESLAVAARARRKGATVVWNFAPAPAVEDREQVAELLAGTDILVVNEHEALAVAETLGHAAGDDYLDAATFLAGSHDCLCIVTAGASGAFAVGSDGSQVHAAAPPVTPVDTTGAGDTFVGVLAGGVAEGLSVEGAMRRACRAASLACLETGAQAGMPSRHELEAMPAQG